MSQTYVPSYAGWLVLAKTAGPTAGTVLAAAAQVQIPFTRAIPFNIFSNAYPGVVNASSYASVSVLGKRRSGFTIVAPVKPSWFTANFINSCLFNLETSTGLNTTDKFSAKFYNTYQSRVFDWARCERIVISGHAMGGPLMATMAFNSRWGETECPYGTTLPDGEVIPAAITFTAPSTPDAGSLTDVTMWDWRSDSALANTNSGATWTAQHVRGFTLTLMRGQGCVDYTDGQKYCKEIASGIFAGSLGLDINPASPTIPTTATTLRVHADKVAGKQFKISMLLNQDSTDQPQDIGLENETINYTLFDSSAGGNPATCAVYS